MSNDQKCKLTQKSQSPKICDISTHEKHNNETHRPTWISRWYRPTLFGVWILFIFGTSCTVIRPLEFFRIIQKFTGFEQVSMERFAMFWGLSWFAIVKGWHVTEFAVLTFFCVGIIKWWRRSIDLSSILGAMIFCIAFAASDEWHQSFVQDRFGTFLDVLIDSIGVGIAGGILIARHIRNA